PSGERIEADVVVLAAGAWTGAIAPWLAEHVRPVGQPVFHLAPGDPAPFAPPLPVFNVDITKTGWYAFPLHGGVVKIANHGVGRPFDPRVADRATNAEEAAALESFASDALPLLARSAGTRVVASRVCVYGDTADQSFWIAPDPEREGLVVATGGSGH